MMSLILQAFHEYYTAFFKEYQATEILEKSTAEQIRIAAPVLFIFGTYGTVLWRLILQTIVRIRVFSMKQFDL